MSEDGAITAIGIIGLVIWLTLGVGPCLKAREAQDNIIECLKARPQSTPEECGKAFK